MDIDPKYDSVVEFYYLDWKPQHSDNHFREPSVWTKANAYDAPGLHFLIPFSVICQRVKAL
jgi:hypothetical protein